MNSIKEIYIVSYTIRELETFGKMMKLTLIPGQVGLMPVFSDAESAIKFNHEYADGKANILKLNCEKFKI